MKHFLLMSAAVLLLLFANAATADVAQDLNWTQYKAQFGKNYLNKEEEAFRLKNFQLNMNYMKEHRQLNELGKGGATFEVGLNEYLDKSNEEFLSAQIAELLQSQQIKRAENTITLSVDTAIPVSMDYRAKGAVTAIKDQGACAAGWAFASTGALESHNFMKNHRLQPMSAQNLLDCTADYGNFGCHGGLAQYSFNYVHDFGLNSEVSYPYEGVKQACRYNSKAVITKMDTGRYVADNEEEMLNALATVGPLVVYVDASLASFKAYASGVYNDESCSKNLNHALLIVGYGVDSKTKTGYWLVKNSWGTSWGEKGYAKIERGKNLCGIETYPYYPQL